MFDLFDPTNQRRVTVSPIEGGDCSTVDLTGLRPLKARRRDFDTLLTTVRASIAVRVSDDHVSADVSILNRRTGLYRRAYETRPIRRCYGATVKARDRAERWIIRHAREVLTHDDAAPVQTLNVENLA